MGESGKRLQKEHNITNEMIEDVLDAINLLEEASKQIRGAPQNLQTGGLVGDVDDIFKEEDEMNIHGKWKGKPARLPACRRRKSKAK